MKLIKYIYLTQNFEFTFNLIISKSLFAIEVYYTMITGKFM